jgi:hypothetical protein
MTYLAFLAGVLVLPTLAYFALDAFQWFLEQFFSMVRQLLS